MAITIETDIYNGPFDLLLSLIEKNKIDIYDLKLSDITEEFLIEVESMKENNPENITEFIYLASTLLELKSRKLLPKNEYIEDAEEISEELILQRLIEYKRFKEASKQLLYLKQCSDLQFSKYQEDLQEYIVEDLENEIIGDCNLLLNELIQIMKRDKLKEENLKKFEIIRAEEYSVDSYMETIQWKLGDNSKLPLNSFVEKNGCKQEVIVVFLSILELIKTKVVKVFQDEVFKEIYVELR
ncbi:segregation and condensation protein A [Miniphocaeibacter massiliensis]|uniref:segregation and condensation protein A n=1 Tax=Miniphocaeibacter massiliensis TaxID=2041841 RepID=UPI000C085566|nr:segregation/condensation protein A [Miniphocaeibacter massiliensis]